MKLKDVTALCAISGIAFCCAFWIGRHGTGWSTGRVQAEVTRAGAGRAPALPAAVPVACEPDHADGRADAARVDAARAASGVPRAVRKLPAIPAADSDEAAATFQLELAGFLTAGNERSYDELPRLWDRAPSLRNPLARAVGAAPDRRGLRFLGSVLGQDENVDGTILAEIGRLAPLADVELAREVAEPVRWVVKSSADITRVQSATYALGRLRDEESIPLLIGLLEGHSGGVRTRAALALEEITGLSYRDEAERWRAWYEGEESWYGEHVDELLVELRSGNERDVFDAVRGLAKLRLHRDEIAAEILFLLGAESASLRRLGCQGLAQLGSPLAVQPLVGLLADADPSVVQSAWIALRWLTGLDLPAERDAWEEATRARFS